MRKFAKQSSSWSPILLGIVVVHSLLMQALTFSFRPALSYAALQAGLPSAALGALSAAFALPGLLLAIPGGRAADRLGERLVATLGGALMLTGALLAFLVPTDAVVIIAATVVFGCGHMLAAIGIQTLLSNRAPAARRDGIFGSYAFAVSLGQGVGGALLSLGAGNATTPNIPLQLTIALCLGAGVLILPLLIPALPRASRLTDTPQRAPLAQLLRRRTVLRAISASAIVVAAVEICLVYLPALGYERQLSAAAVSGMLVARSVAAMASRLGLSWQVRVIGRRRLMVGSIAISAAALLVLALPLPVVWIVALCALFGLTNGVCQPLTLSWLSEIAPPGQRGALTSIRLSAVRIAQSALPLAAGSLSALSGAGGVLAATGVLVAVASWMSAAITDTPRAKPSAEEGAA